MIARLRCTSRSFVLSKSLEVDVDGPPEIVDAVVTAIRKVKVLQDDYEEK